jgi:hypothetical protein
VDPEAERYAVFVPDKEHPAAKAGRYVRAAGIVIGKEIDRRADAAAARPAPPPPPPPPPAPSTHDFVGKTLFIVFLIAIVALGLMLLHADDALPSGTRTIGHLVLAGLMFLEGALLIGNWRQSNQRIGQRLLNRVWGPRGPVNRREKTFARIVRDALTLLGIAFVAAGVFELLVATIGYSR